MEGARDWPTVLTNLVPVLLLISFWIFMIVKMRRAGRSAQAAAQVPYRSGVAYDLHRLEPGRPFILGGLEIDFDKGPVGHSDGDVLSHAVCDALLGAAALGDIGTHFPDTDPQWKDVNSLIFLKRTRELLKKKGLAIIHIDAVVITEKPKLAPHFPGIRAMLADTLGVSPEAISLKAKTNEGVDAIGHGEAIACHAIATLLGP
jgi:2-C-methyl-D-erythritol 2,4-cyclodiphosphate synthase